jgi:hypothetical protein
VDKYDTLEYSRIKANGIRALAEFSVCVNKYQQRHPGAAACSALLAWLPARPIAPACFVASVTELRPRTKVVVTFLGESLAAAVLGVRTGLRAAPSGDDVGRGCGGGRWRRRLGLSPEPPVRVGDEENENRPVLKNLRNRVFQFWVISVRFRF